MNACVHHGNHCDPACPFCAVVEQGKEIKELKKKIEDFYQWFRMPTEKVDALLKGKGPR